MRNGWQAGLERGWSGGGKRANGKNKGLCRGNMCRQSLVGVLQRLWPSSLSTDREIQSDRFTNIRPSTRTDYLQTPLAFTRLLPPVTRITEIRTKRFVSDFYTSTNLWVPTCGSTYEAGDCEHLSRPTQTLYLDVNFLANIFMFVFLYLIFKI